MELSPKVHDALAVFLVVAGLSALIGFGLFFEPVRAPIVGSLIGLVNIVAVWFFQRKKNAVPLGPSPNIPGGTFLPGAPIPPPPPTEGNGDDLSITAS